MSTSHQHPPISPSSPPAEKSRTPLPAGPPTNSQEKISVSPEMEASKAAGGVIQVPASFHQSATTVSDPVPVEKPGEEKGQDGQENEVSCEIDGNDRNEDLEEPETTEVIESNIGQDSELADYDWDDFERRYTDHMSKLDEEENKDYENFDNHATSFLVWAQSASQRDNARISKRLKTRSRFTQLAENSLEDKKRHYVDVVSAFQKALDLLRHQSPQKR
ncbi:hypothetical protein BUE80_DR006659 [Diplocarpon rosae]|nr:hypothetical protein BUE80_DR006659 [Diplocarpon rosae]